MVGVAGAGVAASIAMVFLFLLPRGRPRFLFGGSEPSTGVSGAGRGGAAGGVLGGRTTVTCFFFAGAAAFGALDLAILAAAAALGALEVVFFAAAAPGALEVAFFFDADADEPSAGVFAAGVLGGMTTETWLSSAAEAATDVFLFLLPRGRPLFFGRATSSAGASGSAVGPAPDGATAA